MSSQAKKTSAVPPSSTSVPAPTGRVQRQGFAVGRDETPIYYRVSGAAAAPAVAFCDGIGCDGFVWKYLERELASQYRLVRWHLRGHGRTPPPRDPRRLEIVDSADDLIGVLDAAVGDQTPAVLAGHSMGVQVALEAYRRHPERVSALILACGSYGTPLRTFKGKRTLEQALPFIRFAARRLPDVLARTWRTITPTELAFMFAKRFEINGELIRREDFFPYLEHLAHIDAILFLDMLAAAGRHSARDLLPRVRVPTLIVSGERDGFTPASLSEEMHRLIPGSELLVVPGGTHTAPIERPAEVSARILQFLGELAPPSS